MKKWILIAILQISCTLRFVRSSSVTEDGCIWMQYNETNINSGMTNSADTLEQCQQNCQNRSNSFCRGIDWTSANSAGNKCWTHTGTHGKMTKTDRPTVHYDLLCPSAHFEEQYIGCYNLSTETSPTNLMNATLKACLKLCRQHNSTYAAIQEGNSCTCIDMLNTSLSQERCQPSCTGNETKICGSNSLFSVYIVCPVGFYGLACNSSCHCDQQIPCDRNNGICPNNKCYGNWTGDACNSFNVLDVYRGCYENLYKVGWIADDQTQRDSNPVLKCSSICRGRSYTYFGLKYDMYCFCGNNIDFATSRNETACRLNWTGNATEIRITGNFIGLFTVCPVGNYGEGCYAKCNCMDDAPCSYADGTCPSGCRPGWSGISCNIRNCSNHNGACGVNEVCVRLDSLNSYVSQCSCSRGYQRIRLWDNCTDIDECQLNEHECKSTGSTCFNTVGSYNCSCKTGYASINESCTELPPCRPGNLLCDNEINTCFSLDDGSNCSCSDVFETNCSVTAGQRLDEPSVQIGITIGAAIGALAGILVVLLIIIFLLFSRRRKPKPECAEYEKQTETLPELREIPQISLVTMGKSLFAISDLPFKIRYQLANQEALQKEFQDIPIVIGEFSQLGKNIELKKKNRFKNVVPYESNAVTLSIKDDDHQSEYINASFIQGYNETDSFIATQGPRVETVNDFWRMILEKDVNQIVMVTNLSEGAKVKCERYWPGVGETAVYGDIIVTSKREDSWNDHIIRRFEASVNSESVEVVQLHYINWCDHSVPSDAKELLRFRETVRRHMLPGKYTVVHCSAGSGRTGTFLAIDYLIEQERFTQHIDIPGCVKQLRTQRANMVQNFNQYKLIHTALLTALTIGNTSITQENFLSKYKELKRKSTKSRQTSLEMEFQCLIETSFDSEQTACSQVVSNLVDKNRMTEANAVHVHSWKSKDAYVAMKTLESATDMWKLCKEMNSCIVVYIDDSACSFLPSENNQIVISDDSLLLLGRVSNEIYGTRYEITEHKPQCEYEMTQKTTDIYQNSPVVESSAKSSSSVNLNGFGAGKSSLESNSEPELQVIHTTAKNLENIAYLFMFYKYVNSLQSKAGTPAIVTYKGDDCSEAGFCLAAFNVLEMISKEGEIDIYQVALNIRKSRPELLSSMSSYMALYDVISRYIIAVDDGRISETRKSFFYDQI